MHVRIRQARADDIDAVVEFPRDVGLRGMDGDELRNEFAENRMRWEWTWLAEDDRGNIVGRALWWGRHDSEVPITLECLDISDLVPDRVAVGTDLIGRGPSAEYVLFLEPDWRAEVLAVDAANWRIAAASAAGMTEQLERLKYEWTPDIGVPPASTTVTFREADDSEFVALFHQAAIGTLDITTVRSLAEMDPESQARDDFEFYLDCPSERSWWRVAVDDNGPVGFIVPSATPYSRNVGYLAVLPHARGRGLVDDLLNEITRIHAAAGAEQITATTDTTNTPMAAAFDRAGYRVTEVRILLDAPASHSCQVDAGR